MDEKLRFVVLANEGDHDMTALCKRFGISRNTAYKLLARYRAEGISGLAERSRAPLRHPHAVSALVRDLILDARAAHPSWGPRKLRAYLLRHHPERTWPAPSTIGVLLHQHGVTRPPARRSARPPLALPIADCGAPNDVWCLDFKGWFRTLDRQRCDPFTLTDAHSRYLLRCRIVPRLDDASVRPILEDAFREYGLPLRIRSDNGSPFASTSLGGLTRLSVWWVRLGIVPERIAPGKPQQNGRHERLHRTLVHEVLDEVSANPRAQQRAFDAFRRTYNNERPHEALGQTPPAEHYERSPRKYPKQLPEVEYPSTMQVRRVRSNGEVKWDGLQVFVSEVLAGEPVAFEHCSGPYWRLFYGPIALAMWNEQTQKLLREPSPGQRRGTTAP